MSTKALTEAFDIKGLVSYIEFPDSIILLDGDEKHIAEIYKVKPQED